MAGPSLSTDRGALALAKAAIEHCYDRGWSDGLPVVPVTEDDVLAFLRTTSQPADAVIGVQKHLNRSVTVAQAAANAAMAGCRPEYFPVVLAAWKALELDHLSQIGVWQSTSGPAPLIVVNGPVRERLGINSTGGVLGPGFRPNATIARAIGLIVRNGFGIRQHELGQATQGLPGRWSICFGENEEASPWEPLSVVGGLERGQDAVSATIIRTCEYVDNRDTRRAEEVLADISDTMGRSGAYMYGPNSTAGLILGLEHAHLLAGAGFTRRDVQEWLYDHTVRSHESLRAAGKMLPEDAPDPMPMLASPEDITVIVAGAANAAMSMVFRPLGWTSWTRQSVPIEWNDGEEEA